MSTDSRGCERCTLGTAGWKEREGEKILTKRRVDEKRILRRVEDAGVFSVDSAEYATSRFASEASRRQILHLRGTVRHTSCLTIEAFVRYRAIIPHSAHPLNSQIVFRALTPHALKRPSVFDARVRACDGPTRGNRTVPSRRSCAL